VSNTSSALNNNNKIIEKRTKTLSGESSVR